jgi:hypothetical protein
MDSETVGAALRGRPFFFFYDLVIQGAVGKYATLWSATARRRFGLRYDFVIFVFVKDRRNERRGGHGVPTSVGKLGSAYGTRTRDLCLERANHLLCTELDQVGSVGTPC